MGSHRHTRPLASANAFALKQVVKHFWGRDSFNLGDIKGLRLEETLVRFDAAAWAEKARAESHVRIVGTNRKQFRLNRSCRPVIEAAMEAGHLASKAMAEARARDLITKDGVEFVAFCEVIAEKYPNGQLFTVADVHESICALLTLDPKIWAEASVSSLLVEMGRLMPLRIKYESMNGGGYQFKVMLPPAPPKEVMIVKASEKKVAVEEVPVDVPEPPVRSSAAPSKRLNGYREIAFLEAMVAHWGDRVIPSKDIGEAMGRVSSEWAKYTTYNNFLVAFRKAGILLPCTKTGGLESSTRGFSRLNMAHSQVDQIRKRLAATSAVTTVVTEVEEEDVNTSLESLTQATLEPETKVVENVEPNEPGSPALTSEDENEGRDREELPAPPEEIVLPSTPPIYTRAELEERIRQVQAKQLQDSVERREIAEQIRILKERDLELSQMVPLREQEIIYLEQELTKLEHAEKEAVSKQVEALLESLSPLMRELLKAKLFERD